MRVGVIHVPVLACEIFKIFKLICSLEGQMSKLSVAKGIGMQWLQWLQRVSCLVQLSWTHLTVGLGLEKNVGKDFKDKDVLGLSGEVVWAKGPSSIGIEEAGLGGPPRPTFNKVVMCLFSARAPFVPVGGDGGMDLEPLVVEVTVVGELLSRRLMATNEALMEEASKYSVDRKSSLSLGLRRSSSSSPL